jgi:small nuclear ribonucleoprotein (snRNP)-like protein
VCGRTQNTDTRKPTFSRHLPQAGPERLGPAAPRRPRAPTVTPWCQQCRRADRSPDVPGAHPARQPRPAPARSTPTPRRGPGSTPVGPDAPFLLALRALPARVRRPRAVQAHPPGGSAPGCPVRASLRRLTAPRPQQRYDPPAPLIMSFTSPAALVTVRVLLHDGQLIRGMFLSFDPVWNPILQDCVEVHPQAGRHVPGPLVFPRAAIASLAVEPVPSKREIGFKPFPKCFW